MTLHCCGATSRSGGATKANAAVHTANFPAEQSVNWHYTEIFGAVQSRRNALVEMRGSQFEKSYRLWLYHIVVLRRRIHYRMCSALKGACVKIIIWVLTYIFNRSLWTVDAPLQKVTVYRIQLLTFYRANGSCILRPCALPLHVHAWFARQSVAETMLSMSAFAGRFIGLTSARRFTPASDPTWAARCFQMPSRHNVRDVPWPCWV